MLNASLGQKNIVNYKNSEKIENQNSSPIAPNLSEGASKQDGVHLSFKSKTEAPEEERDEFITQVLEDLDEAIKTYKNRGLTRKQIEITQEAKNETNRKLTEYLKKIKTGKFTDEQKEILKKAIDYSTSPNIKDRKQLVDDAIKLPRNIFEKIIILSGNDKDEEVRRYVTNNYTDYLMDDKVCNKFILDRLNDPSSIVSLAAISKIGFMSDKEKGASFLRKQIKRITDKDFVNFRQLDKDREFLKILINAAFDLRHPKLVAELCVSDDNFIREYANGIYKEKFQYGILMNWFPTAIKHGEKHADAVNKEYTDFGSKVSDAIERLKAK